MLNWSVRVMFLPPENIACFPAHDSPGEEAGIGQSNAGRWHCSIDPIEVVCVYLLGQLTCLSLIFLNPSCFFFQSKTNCKKGLCLSELANYIDLL